MTIRVETEVTDPALDFDYEKIAEQVIVAALDYEDCPYEAEVDLTLTTDEEIHKVNKEFRGIDRPTDVLSFPLLEYARHRRIFPGWRKTRRTVSTRRAGS